MNTRISAGFFFLVILMLIISFFLFTSSNATAQELPTPTLTLRPEMVTVTVTYDEAINVRAGPNSVYYPVVGQLPVGAVVQALGRSLAGEWIMINFPESSDGSRVGWVYAPLVTLSGGFLPVMEPPATLVPRLVPTLDPDFILSLQPEPTQTRMATFTAPAPLSLPTYANPISESGGIGAGIWIAVFGVLGIVWLIISSNRTTR